MKVNHMELGWKALHKELAKLQYVNLGEGPNGTHAYLSPVGHLIEIKVGNGDSDVVQSIAYVNKVDIKD